LPDREGGPSRSSSPHDSLHWAAQAVTVTPPPADRCAFRIARSERSKRRAVLRVAARNLLAASAAVGKASHAAAGGEGGAHPRCSTKTTKCELVHTDIGGPLTESLGGSTSFNTSLQGSTGSFTAAPSETKGMAYQVLETRIKQL